MSSPAPAQRLGPYELIELIGKGGMGEVWRARDPRLGREVAIKTSAQQFTDRFEREARAIAALNHPNVCHLYDVGPNYLVMELVEGPTLADRIKQGPVPLEEALAIAQQIADGLEAAHERGIIHRDLKPANIKLRPDGSVKILDFGLAKSAIEEGPLTPDSPTMLSMTGMILGTAGYMAPEQAKGKPVDRRADIFAFGVVVYEMVTGQRLFLGETISDTLAAVIKDEPDWKPVPAKVQRLLARCLEKDPKKRLRDIGDTILLLEETPRQTPVRAGTKLPWAVAALCLCGGIAIAALHFTEHPTPQPVVRFNVPPPGPTPFPGNTPRMAISPDGTTLAFQFPGRDGKMQLWVRRLDATEARPVPGTEGAELPFWSADSRTIGFFADGKVKRVEAAGGPAQVLCDGPGNDGGGTWNREGTILFSGRYTAVTRVPANGGVPVQVTTLAAGESDHRWPRFLPDGHHFLYFATGTKPEQSGVYVSSIDGMQPKRVLSSPSMAEYANGYLLFRLNQALMARPLDVKKLELTGEPSLIEPSVGAVAGNGRVGFSVSGNGYLAFWDESLGGAVRMAWIDRRGKEADEVVKGLGLAGAPRLSPDGKQVVFTRNDGSGSQNNVWLLDFARGVPSRLTFRPGRPRDTVWGPDGNTIVYTTGNDLYRKSASGLGEDELLLKSDGPLEPVDVSPDGKILLYTRGNIGTRDIYALPLAGRREPTAIQATSFDESHAQFSPDGRWIAFVTNETGRREVYVRSFPGNERKIQISADSGSEPRWSRDGKELFYINLNNGTSNTLMTVRVKSMNPFEAGSPLPLFPVPALSSPTSWHYDVSSDGSRFLFFVPESENQAPRPITVVQNWTAGLKK